MNSRFPWNTQQSHFLNYLWIFKRLTSRIYSTNILPFADLKSLKDYSKHQPRDAYSSVDAVSLQIQKAYGVFTWSLLHL